MCCCRSDFFAGGKYWSEKLTCICVCLPLQQTDGYKEHVRTIRGGEKKIENNAVVKRRFDGPLCWSPVQESTAVLRMH